MATSGNVSGQTTTSTCSPNSSSMELPPVISYASKLKAAATCSSPIDHQPQTTTVNGNLNSVSSPLTPNGPSMTNEQSPGHKHEHQLNNCSNLSSDVDDHESLPIDVNFNSNQQQQQKPQSPPNSTSTS